MAYSNPVYISLHVIAMCTCFLSMVGSGTIIYLVLKRSKKRTEPRTRRHEQANHQHQNPLDEEEQIQPNNIDDTNSQGCISWFFSSFHFDFETYHFLVGMLSIGDFISSLTILISPFMVPTYVPEKPWAKGNLQSCAASAFFLTFTSCKIAAMNFLLAFYFLRSIRSKNKLRTTTNRRRRDSSGSGTTSSNLGGEKLTWEWVVAVVLLAIIMPLTWSTLLASQYGLAFSSTIQYCAAYGDYPDGCRDDPNIECLRPRNGERGDTIVLLLGSLCVSPFRVLFVVSLHIVALYDVSKLQ